MRANIDKRLCSNVGTVIIPEGFRELLFSTRKNVTFIRSTNFSHRQVTDPGNAYYMFDINSQESVYALATHRKF